MGFGAGSALTVVPIASMIKTGGYEATFLYFGLGQGLVVFVLGWLLRQPARHGTSAAIGARRNHVAATAVRFK